MGKKQALIDVVLVKEHGWQEIWSFILHYVRPVQKPHFLMKLQTN